MAELHFKPVSYWDYTGYEVSVIDTGEVLGSIRKHIGWYFMSSSNYPLGTPAIPTVMMKRITEFMEGL